MKGVGHWDNVGYICGQWVGSQVGENVKKCKVIMVFWFLLGFSKVD